MSRRARTLMAVVSARGVLVLTCCSSPSPPAGGGGASRVRLGRPRGRPSCPPAVGCEPRPPWVCPSERLLVLLAGFLGPGRTRRALAGVNR